MDTKMFSTMDLNLHSFLVREMNKCRPGGKCFEKGLLATRIVRSNDDVRQQIRGLRLELPGESK